MTKFAGFVASVAACVVALGSGCQVHMGSGSSGGPGAASGGESAESAAAEQPGATTTAPGARAGRVIRDQPTAQAADGTSGDGTSASSSGGGASASSSGGSAAPGSGSGEATASAGGAPAGGGGDGCFTQENELRCPESEVREAYEQLTQAASQIGQLGNRSEYTLSDTVTPDLDEIRAKLVKQQEAQAVASTVRPFLARFQARFLSNRIERHDPPDVMGARFRSIDNHAEETLWEVINGLQHIDEAAARNAAACIEKPVMEMRAIDARHEMYRVRLLSEALASLDLCPRFDPSNASVAARAEELRPQVNEMLERYREQELEQIRSRSWEGSIGRVSAGNPGALAGAGRAYLRNHDNWGRNDRHTQVLAVSVRGDWFVATRNIFGQPAQWGLPVHVAITNEDTPDDIVQVYELSLVTTGRNKGGNFGSYRVGNTWRILRSALP